MKKVLIIFVVILAIVAIPLAIDWLIIGNNFHSHVTMEAWMSFFGGYLGGLATLTAVVITIRENDKKIQKIQFEESRAILVAEAETTQYDLKKYYPKDVKRVYRTDEDQKKRHPSTLTMFIRLTLMSKIPVKDVHITISSLREQEHTEHKAYIPIITGEDQVLIALPVSFTSISGGKIVNAFTGDECKYDETLQSINLNYMTNMNEQIVADVSETKAVYKIEGKTIFEYNPNGGCHYVMPIE